MTTFDFDDKYIEELRQDWYFPKHVMDLHSKRRVLNGVHRSEEHPRKKKWGLKISVFIALPTSLALFGFTLPKVFQGIIYPDGTQVAQGPAPTPDQIQHVQDSINGIGLPYAEFVRVHQLGNFPASEIAYSKNEALNNSNIQEIIVPYGIFMRMSPEQQKEEELKDPQWAHNHQLIPHDVVLIKEALAKHATETGTPSSGN